MKKEYLSQKIDEQDLAGLQRIYTDLMRSLGVTLAVGDISLFGKTCFSVDQALRFSNFEDYEGETKEETLTRFYGQFLALSQLGLSLSDLGTTKIDLRSVGVEKVIVRSLSEEGPLDYSNLRNNLDQELPCNELTTIEDKLKQLEDENIIKRISYPEEAYDYYELTLKGGELAIYCFLKD